MLCPSLFPRVYSNSCPLCQWCHPIISSSAAPFFFYFQSFLAIRVFSNESALHIRWPKYWSFSFSPSSEYSGLISFRIDWFDLLAVQGTLKSFLQHQNSKASILHCSDFIMIQLSPTGRVLIWGWNDDEIPPGGSDAEMEIHMQAVCWVAHRLTGHLWARKRGSLD